ncbi:flagellar filament capping protein FliD [Chengkuizengella sediminis]|uniref:flagellar filament capping protein FliD n=1 Tax=Chengkuizengella sediminis TaxID=1885917 RepID=UPI001389B4F2|nr:flagellar filament capping protein FliD [Chengkuizengella sediminis]NDI36513.1 flagellar filament capping protein FliD [Chengkuizengella sediminis]
MEIRFTGLASGIDTESIVTELMNVERLKLMKLERSNQKTEWIRQDYLDINAKILDYRNNKVFNFTLEGTLSSKKTQLYGDTGSITVKASTSAVNGTIQVEVKSLATAATNYSKDPIALDGFVSNESLQSQEVLLNGAPTLSETYKFSINGTEIEVNTTEDSLDDIIEKINKNTDVSAYYSDAEKKISFVANETGASTIDFNDLDGDFLTNILKVDSTNELAGTDAEVYINGLQTFQSSNTFDVNGVEVTIQEVGSPTTIEVSNDVDAIVESVNQFIEEYNEILNTLQEKVGEDKDYDYYPLSDEEKDELTEDEIEKWEEQAKSGLLKNDDYITKAIDAMRSISYTSVDTGSDIYNTLSSIGITTGTYQEKGKLYLDESKLREAIEADAEAVVNMFAVDSSSAENTEGAGVGEIIYDALGDTLKEVTDVAGTSSTSFDDSILGKKMKELDQDIFDWENRLIDIEERYYAQFTAMELAIESYNSQLEYILSAFGGQQA